MSDPFVGEVAIVRLYRGSLFTGQTLYNANKQQEVSVHRIYSLREIKGESIDRFSAGEIACVVGMHPLSKGDTLCDPQHKLRLNIKMSEPPMV